MDRSNLIARAGLAERMWTIARVVDGCFFFDTSYAGIAFIRREMTGIGWNQRRTM